MGSKFDNYLRTKSLCARKIPLCGSDLHNGYHYLISNFKNKPLKEILGDGQDSLCVISTELGEICHKPSQFP